MNQETFTPNEVAEKLGISVRMVQYLRQTGRIKGTRVGNSNMYVYTQEQINEANLESRKSGPKPKQQKTAKNDEGEGTALLRVAL